jgi:hypothetical protein
MQRRQQQCCAQLLRQPADAQQAVAGPTQLDPLRLRQQVPGHLFWYGAGQWTERCGGFADYGRRRVAQQPDRLLDRYPPNLASTLLTCVVTVPALTCSRVAISALGSPVAMSRRTSLALGQQRGQRIWGAGP